MMMWYGGDGGWVGWTLMTVAMVVFWALLITAVVLLVRYLASPQRGGANPAAGSTHAENLLAERYARGEIDEEEYQRRITILRQGR
jgi:putative membrane protein